MEQAGRPFQVADIPDTDLIVLGEQRESCSTGTFFTRYPLPIRLQITNNMLDRSWRRVGPT